MSDSTTGKKKPVKVKTYLCDQCGKVSKNYSQHYEHTQRHSTVRRYRCLICAAVGVNSSFKTCSGLSKHKKTHANKKNPNPSCICNVCNKHFSTVTNLKIHKETVHVDLIKETIGLSEASCTCGICGKKFPHVYSVQRHIRRIHNKQKNQKTFECEICHHRFVDRNGLKIHLRIHNKEKPFECNHCHKRFSQINNLKDHLNTHLSERPYTCDICGKGFNQRSNLNTHKKRNHTLEDPNVILNPKIPC